MERHKPQLLVAGNLAKDIVFGTERYGGSAALIAITATKLGVDVGIISVIGKDKFSKKYISYLDSIGVGTELIQHKIENIPTCEVVSSENKISSSVWTDNGSHQAMDELQLSPEVEKYNLIHLVSCTPGLALSLANTNKNLSYEPGPLLPYDSNYFNTSVASSSNLLFLNEEEYLALVKYDKGISKDGHNFPNLSAMVVTLGKDGSIVFSGNETIKIPAIQLKGNAVDSVGAGDNFKAGFLAGYLYGLPFKTCAQIGSELGALCVQQEGAILSEIDIARIKKKYFS